MDIQRLIHRMNALVADFEIAVNDCRVVAEALMDAGVDAEAIFSGQAAQLPISLAEGLNWDKLAELLAAYGPEIYSIQLKTGVFGVPPVPPQTAREASS